LADEASLSFFVEMQFLNCQKDNSGLVVITILELSKAQCNNTDFFLSSDFLGRNTTGLDKQSLSFNN